MTQKFLKKNWKTSKNNYLPNIVVFSKPNTGTMLKTFPIYLQSNFILFYQKYLLKKHFYNECLKLQALLRIKLWDINFLRAIIMKLDFLWVKNVQMKLETN